jgi:radical SAM protein with 4Fe4S-binding SPASM domain
MGYYRKKVITFFINEVCNMKCVYCPIHSERAAKDSSGKVIDIDFAKCGIDDYFNNEYFEKGEKRGIRIFANGEPTMEISTVKEIINYANLKSNGNLFVEMQTNGYFDEDIAYWLRENVDLLWFSLDGIGEVQNNQRLLMEGLPSFDIIDKNIKIISSSNKTTIGLRPTISTTNLNRQNELIDYATNNNISRICVDPWVNLTGKIEGQPDLLEFAKEYLKAWKYGKTKNLEYGTTFTVNFDEEVEIYCRSVRPTPEFTPDGFVSCCDMVNNGDSFLVKVFPELIFGHYNAEEKKIHYNEKHKEKIKTRNINNLTDCQGCEVLKHCAGGCIGIAMVSSVDFYGRHKEYCAVTKYLFKHMQEDVNVGYNPSIPIHP